MSEKKTPKKGAEAPTAPTLREALNVQGDLRVATVTMNLWQGQVAFTVEEGERTEDGFLPNRVLGQFGLTGDGIKTFRSHVAEGTTAKGIYDFLLNHFTGTLDKPVQTAQQQ